MVKTVHRANHALLRSATAVGTKEFPFLSALGASGLNPRGKRSNSTHTIQGMLRVT